MQIVEKIENKDSSFATSVRKWIKMKYKIQVSKTTTINTLKNCDLKSYV